MNWKTSKITPKPNEWILVLDTFENISNIFYGKFINVDKKGFWHINLLNNSVAELDMSTCHWIPMPPPIISKPALKAYMNKEKNYIKYGKNK